MPSRTHPLTTPSTPFSFHFPPLIIVKSQANLNLNLPLKPSPTYIIKPGIFEASDYTILYYTVEYQYNLEKVANYKIIIKISMAYTSA